MGMPLTAQCDGDVMARCNVDKLAAPFVEPGYVLGCLAKHAAKLHKPCWELISSMDDGWGGAAWGRGAGAEPQKMTFRLAWIGTVAQGCTTSLWLTVRRVVLAASTI